ncbi:hypothetical protein C2845_PM05G28400 [Panicum miliaceum]|uniref:Uncharacterized protein n=1 Tax=Panicum miliaceum TaxID=4540 RepID=A0A3L6T1Y8_PANMI|nr:hypothetical protein C2845_PM05G28400 [Panicum miliaceum]
MFQSEWLKATGAPTGVFVKTPSPSLKIVSRSSHPNSSPVSSPPPRRFLPAVPRAAPRPPHGGAAPLRPLHHGAPPLRIRQGHDSQHRRRRPGCLAERRLLPSGSGEGRGCGGGGWASSGGHGCRAGGVPQPCLPVWVPLLSLAPLLRWRWCSGGAAACRPLPSRFDGSTSTPSH